MNNLVAHVSEIGLSWPKYLDNGQSFRQTQMRRVRTVAKRVQHQNLDATQQRERCGRYRFRVSDVGERPTAESVNCPAAMQNGYRDNGVAEKLEGAVELIQAQVWFPAVERQWIAECVPEARAEFTRCCRIGVDWQRGLRQVVELAEIVESSDMIGVSVGEQDSVDTGQPTSECLEPELRRSIDEDIPFAEMQYGRAACPPVARVDRRTGVAVTTDHRYAVRGSRSQKGQSQHSHRLTCRSPFPTRLWLAEDQPPVRTGTDDTRFLSRYCRSF